MFLLCNFYFLLSSRLHRLVRARGCELECDSIANSISAAILRRPLEPLNEDTAVSFNDSAGSNIDWVRRDFDVFQPLSASMFQHQFQRQLGIAAAFLPWHNRIANVSEDVRGQL